MYVGLRAQDLDSMHRASLFDPSSAGGTDEGSIAHEAMRFYAKLTASAVYLGITYYSWVEQQRVVDAGGGVPGFVDLPGGRFGSVPGDPTGATAFSNPATEPNNAAPVPPVIVRIGKSYFDPALGTVYIATIASATFTATSLQWAHWRLASANSFSPGAYAAVQFPAAATDGFPSAGVGYTYNPGPLTITIPALASPSIWALVCSISITPLVDDTAGDWAELVLLGGGPFLTIPIGTSARFSPGQSLWRLNLTSFQKIGTGVTTWSAGLPALKVGRNCFLDAAQGCDLFLSQIGTTG